MLQVALTKQRGEFQLNASVEVQARTTLVVVGESGAGKTTLLRLLAGLDDPDDGRISVGDRVYFDAQAKRTTPPWLRDVGYVPQDYALFPHLTALENAAFGLRAQGTPRRAARARGQQALDRMGIVDLAARRPTALSGGQQQRVALARALALEPSLLLLDEPLSALDLQTRQAIRGELKSLLASLDCITVYVTHAPLEALVFGDRIAVMERGCLTQVGTRAELLHRPRSPYAAALLGVNLFCGTVTERGSGGIATVRTASGVLTVTDPEQEGDVFVAVNPQQITLYSDRPTGSAQNTFQGRIAELVPQPPSGERVRVVLETNPPLVAEVTRQAVEELGLTEGARVYAAFKATGVTAYS